MDIISLHVEQTISQIKIKNDFFKDDFLINRLLIIIEKFLKLHIKIKLTMGQK